eukprot:1160120-Pelagomonas_calceolata.AAC.5
MKQKVPKLTSAPWNGQGRSRSATPTSLVPQASSAGSMEHGSRSEQILDNNLATKLHVLVHAGPNAQELQVPPSNQADNLAAPVSAFPEAHLRIMCPALIVHKQIASPLLASLVLMQQVPPSNQADNLAAPVPPSNQVDNLAAPVYSMVEWGKAFLGRATAQWLTLSKNFQTTPTLAVALMDANGHEFVPDSEAQHPELQTHADVGGNTARLNPPIVQDDVAFAWGTVAEEQFKSAADEQKRAAVERKKAAAKKKSAAAAGGPAKRARVAQGNRGRGGTAGGRQGRGGSGSASKRGGGQR